MSKEMMIVFVYDTECCQNESDDPVNAVLYFHPSWVSDIQKLSLCGQLMGTTHFFQDSFTKPKIISLQSGRFVLKEFGRFILAVGTDRNLSKSVLEHRAEILTSLIKFFHCDIQSMHDQFSTTAGTTIQQYKSLSEKLYHIFETFLPILQYNGNLFQNMPISRLPKSASNIYLEAMQTLHSCQQTKGVLGGTIFYHNKVVVTQLSPEITKNLILTDPDHIKSTAESIIVDFHVPIGVQLIAVYIPLNEYRKLVGDVQRSQTIPNQINNSSSSILPFQFKKKMKRDKSIIFTNIPEEVGNINECDSIMEIKDTGTVIIGDGDSVNCDVRRNRIEGTKKHTDEFKIPPSAATATAIGAATAPTEIKCMRPRPTHLPLRFKNVTAKELPESGFNSINFDESDSFPQFIGRTSVCSTPLTENKLLHGNVLSICANLDETVSINSNSNDKMDIVQSPPPPPIHNINNEEDTKDTILENQNNNNNNSINATTTICSYDKNSNKITTNYIENPFKYEVRRNSLNDVNSTLKKLSKRFSIRPFGPFNIAKLLMPTKKYHYNNHGSSTELSTTNFDDTAAIRGFIDTELDDINRKIYHTINDPTYPVFNSDGAPISKYLFQEYLERQYQKLIKNKNGKTVMTVTDDDDDDGNNINENNNNNNNIIEGFDMEMDMKLPSPVSKLQSIDLPPILPSPSTISLKLKDELENDNLQKVKINNNNNNNSGIEIKTQVNVNSHLNRKSLTLPLKSLTTTTTTDLSNDTNNEFVKDTLNKFTNNNNNNTVLESPAQRKKLSGIQLTPLMSKLTILSVAPPPPPPPPPQPQPQPQQQPNDERSSGFSSWDTTPGLVELATPIDVTKLFRRRSSIKYDDIVDVNGIMQKVELFICGQQNMTMILLLEENSGQKQELVQSMFDTCVSKLSRMELNLNQTLNVNVDGDKGGGGGGGVGSDSGGYSFISLDENWDTLQRCGPWTPADLNSVEYMRNDFAKISGITDLILRTDDSVLYGYKYSKSGIFYKQTSQQSYSGLPPPADLMGTIPICAKRRLERDHSIMLL